MATVQDVAAYVLRERGGMTAMKLQKLCYYAQAWHLVWEERSLFGDEIQAWANGPVAPALYRSHRGVFHLTELPEGNPEALDPNEVGTIDAILGHYAPMSAHELSELSHRESPWADARHGIPAGRRSQERITHSARVEYYDGLTAANTERG